MVGASWRVWDGGGSGDAVLYADYRNTFKPAAIDFGPDNTPDVLQPEIASSWEAGLKGALDHGRLGWRVSAFLLNFGNLVVATEDGLRNAGSERLKGVDAEARWRVAPDLSLIGDIAWHDARFVHASILEDDVETDVSGKHLTMAPAVLASLGLAYQPQQGWFASVVAAFAGSRYLDAANTARTGGYAVVDATVGRRWRRWSLALRGENLSDQRPPVTQSEFGDSSYYLMPARRIFASLTRSF
jgi:iron complex outermembrane receptor protein